MAENLIPAEHAEFFWNGEVGQAPSEFVVMDIRERRALQEAGRRDPTDHLRSSMGAHVADWLTGDGPQDHPGGIFALEYLDKRASPDRIREGLTQLAKIDRCEWARLMLGTLKFYDDRDG